MGTQRKLQTTERSGGAISCAVGLAAMSTGSCRVAVATCSLGRANFPASREVPAGAVEGICTQPGPCLVSMTPPCTHTRTHTTIITTTKMSPAPDVAAVIAATVTAAAAMRLLLLLLHALPP